MIPSRVSSCDTVVAVEALEAASRAETEKHRALQSLSNEQRQKELIEHQLEWHKKQAALREDNPSTQTTRQCTTSTAAVQCSILRDNHRRAAPTSTDTAARSKPATIYVSNVQLQSAHKELSDAQRDLLRLRARLKQCKRHCDITHDEGPSHDQICAQLRDRALTAETTAARLQTENRSLLKQMAQMRTGVKSPRADQLIRSETPMFRSPGSPCSVFSPGSPSLFSPKQYREVFSQLLSGGVSVDVSNNPVYNA